MKISNSPMLLLGVSLAVGLSACSSKARDEAPPLPDFTLSVTKTGNGTVSSSPAGINCGASCVADFSSGTEITLTPAPDAGHRFIEWGGVCAGTPATNACDVDLTSDATVSARFFPIQTLGDTYALTNSNQLISFNRAAPENILSVVDVTGLAAGELLVGMDFRPSNGLLYAVGTSDNLYRIDHTATGPTTSATLVGALGGNVVDPAVSYGVDINPVVDAMRLIGSDGSNSVVNLSSGAASAQTAVPGTSTLSAAAYTNSFATATGTVLLAIDTSNDQLVLLPDPNAGTARVAGSLRVDASGDASFDIIGSNLEAIAVLRVDGANRLFSINLGNGVAQQIGSLGNQSGIVGLAARVMAPAGTVGDSLAVTTAVVAGADNVLVPFNDLISFARTTPQTLTSRLRVLGLRAGEKVVAGDFRPLDQQLYLLGDGARVYRLNRSTGLATEVSELNGGGFAGLQGSDFGAGFEPISGSLKVVSSGRQNLSVNVDDGTVTNDGALVYSNNPIDPTDDENATATAVDFTNSFQGTLVSTAYVLDTDQDSLAVLDGNDLGTEVADGTDGDLRVDADGVNGFQIDPVNGLAYAALRVGGSNQLFTINLGTGQATAVNTIGNGSEAIVMLSWAPPQEALAYAVTADDRLISFLPSDPATLLSDVAISGLQVSGEVVVAIDFQVSTGALVAVTSGSRLYRLNRTTGAATAIATMTASVNDPNDPFAGFSGAVNNFGANLNPTLPVNSASFRITTLDGGGNAKNFRTNSQTGETFSDPDLSYPMPGVPPSACELGTTPDVGAVANSNDFLGAATTVTYVIDAGTGCLFTLDPTSGDATAIAPVFTTASGEAINSSIGGYAIIGGHNGLRIAALDVGAAQSRLVEIDESASTAPPDPGVAGQDLGSVAATGLIRSMTLVLDPAQ